MSARRNGSSAPTGGGGSPASFLTISLARLIIGTLSAVDHTAVANRPPAASRSYRLLSALARSGMNIRPQRQTTASNPRSAIESDSASLSRKSILLSPRAAARSRAIASIPADWSVATTRPPGPTRRAAVTAGSPLPVAISSTRAPAFTPASSTRRSLTCWAARSNTGHHFFHPAAAASQSRRWSLFRRCGSKVCSLMAQLLFNRVPECFK